MQFLLTPLREGRHWRLTSSSLNSTYFYSRPCGRGDLQRSGSWSTTAYFYSRPCGRGDITVIMQGFDVIDFYSRPCGRGDGNAAVDWVLDFSFLLTPLREGRRRRRYAARRRRAISTHAPAGGATAIFHKSVMRFCGKLPKDDTVLCLASFGFPRRDPKAVYLAWISCANLPQKCVRQGLALKDQGTSCFHEGLASHAFDPVLV